MLTLTHPVQLIPEKIAQEALHDHHTSISVCGRPIFNLRFADDIDRMGGSNGELQRLHQQTRRQTTVYGMKTRAEKSKIMTNSTNNISARIGMNGQKLEEVTSFKHLGATLYLDGTCLAELHMKVASAMASVARLNRIRRCDTISFASKFKVYKSLVISILLYGCETWTLLSDSEKKNPVFRNQALEETSPHLLLGAQDQRPGAEQDQLLCGSTGTSSGNCQETEACMVRACHTPRQPLQNHPSGHLGGLATPWSAEDQLDGQHQRVDIPCHARTAHYGLLQKRLEEDLC